jgi:hypothetical protein
MSRTDRFEKLESERKAQPATEAPRVSEERFREPSTSPSPPSDGPHAPAFEAAREASPLGSEATPSPLTRFEADGTNQLAIDTDPLTRLPIRRCPECQQDSAKFDRVCGHCGASLETPAARALNLALLETFTTERAAEEAAQRAAHQAAIQAKADEALQQAAEAERVDTRRVQLGWRMVARGGALLCFIVAVWSSALCPAVAFIAVGLVLLVATLPRAALEALVKPVTSRW